MPRESAHTHLARREHREAKKTQKRLEIIMKTLIATIVALSIAASAIPASAGYVAPEASWQVKAFTVGQP